MHRLVEMLLGISVIIMTALHCFAHLAPALNVLYILSWIFFAYMAVWRVVLYFRGGKEAAVPRSFADALCLSGERHLPVWLALIFLDRFLRAEWRTGFSVLNALCRVFLDFAIVLIVSLVEERFHLRKSRGKITASVLCRRYMPAAAIFYYVTLGAALVRFTLTTTMFPAVMDEPVRDFINTFSLVLLDMSILAFAVSLACVRKHFQFVFELAILAVFYIWHSQVTDCALIQYLIILVLGATGKKFRTILKVYLGVKVPIFVAAFYASQHGYIYNKTALKLDEMSHSLGTINSTDCAAYVLFMLIAYCVLRQPYRSKDWKSFIDYPILLLVVQYFHHLTVARANGTWMYLVIGLSFAFHIGSLRKWPVRSRKIFRGICYALTPIYAVILLVTMVAIAGYGTKGPAGAITAGIKDHSMLMRFWVPQNAIRDYGITLFGCFDIYPDVGRGGNTADIEAWISSNYSFIDMSYPRMLIIYGILITIIMMCLFLFTNIRCVRQGYYYLLGILVIVAFTGVIEHHLTEFYYDMLVMAAFARLDGKRYAENKKVRK